MKIKTELLKEMLSKSIKGASNNKLLPITSLIGIQVKDSKLILMTTDGTNKLYVSTTIEFDPVVGTQEFYTVVNAEMFAKLISKTTKEFVELTNQQNYLEVKGNGTYKLDLPINEDGDLIKFAELTIDSEEGEKVSGEILKKIINTSKSSILKTMDIPVLTGYYLGKESIATDRQLVCYMKTDIESDKPILISSSTAELIQLLSDTAITVINSDKLIFTDGSVSIVTKELEGKEMYPVNAIINLTKLQYQSHVKLNKADLLNVLDRMSLFVTDYDKNGIYLNFTLEGLEIRSQKSNAAELIEINNTIDKEFECLIDIDMLKSQVQSLSKDVVELYYGQPSSVELVEDDTILVISLVEKAN